MSFVHANDAAMGNLGYQRNRLDHYATPPWVTEAICPILLQHIDADTPVWEPACGDGRMATVLRRYFTVIATDITDYGYAEQMQPPLDFLWTNELNERRAIVTNPPFGMLAAQFIRKALSITKRYEGVVAMLLRHEYDCAKERITLFNQPPFAKKLVLTSRPRWIEDSTGAPRHNYSWFLFDWRHQGSATLVYHEQSKSRS
jgi:hypothetical protein